MTAKDRILQVSRLLFNKVGVDNVAARTICRALNISPGNFSYHYPDKNRVISDLFQSMVTENRAVLTSMAASEISIVTYLEAHRKLFLIQEKYRFFYLNLFGILTNNPGIRALFLMSAKAERKMASDLLQLYTSKGVLKKTITSEQSERLINVGRILNCSWLTDAELLYNGTRKQRLSHYLKICCGLLEPYLTAAARKEYQEYFKTPRAHSVIA